MFSAYEEPGCETLRVPVVEVSDGDGFVTTFANRRLAVRFGFVDAPEIGQFGGQEAKEFLLSLIYDRWVELVILTKSDTGGITDRHGRIVCVPYLCDQNKFGLMRNIEVEMVLNGWAWVMERYGPAEHYFEALADAQRNKRGIWARDDNIDPWEFKRQRYRNRPARTRIGHLKLFGDQVDREPCPQNCGGTLIEKSGRFGRFVGCSNYPKCRHTMAC